MPRMNPLTVHGTCSELLHEHFRVMGGHELGFATLHRDGGESRGLPRLHRTGHGYRPVMGHGIFSVRECVEYGLWYLVRALPSHA